MYNDSIKRLESAARSRLSEHLEESKRIADNASAIDSNAGRPLNFFKPPSMLTRSRRERLITPAKEKAPVDRMQI